MLIDSKLTKELQSKMLKLAKSLKIDKVEGILYISYFSEHIAVRSIPVDYCEMDYILNESYFQDGIMMRTGQTYFSNDKKTAYRLIVDEDSNKKLVKDLKAVLDCLSKNKIVVDCIYYKVNNSQDMVKGELVNTGKFNIMYI